MAAQKVFILKKTIPYLVAMPRTLSSRVLSPTFRVESSDALVDDPVSIRVSWLQKDQKVTLSAALKNYGKDFLSCAHYTADVRGEVNTVVQPSEGGTFEGDGPYPAVIEMTGANEDIFLDFKGALLASRGFLILSLAYMGYDNLPTYPDVDFSYFMEATDWLGQHSKVTPGGIGVYGSCLGATIAYNLSDYSSKVFG